MGLARVLGAVGRGLISAGVIVLLFVAYQLWGTGIQNAAAQNDLGSDFAEATGIESEGSDAESLSEQARASQEAIGEGRILASDEAIPIPETESEGQNAFANHSDDEATVTDVEVSAADLVETNLDTATRQQIQASLYPAAGEALARINIPAINVDQISVEGVSVEDLRKGPGHYRTTPNPGQAGNAAIAGHRTTYGAPFHRIDELTPGDAIFVTTVQGVFEYRVLSFEDPSGGRARGYFIVSPSDTWVLDQREGQNILTLTACHPKYSARQRIIVQAELVGEPAPTIPRDDAEDLGVVTLDSGDAVDERGQGGTEAREPINNEVLADDDPSVDPDGVPIEVTAAEISTNDGRPSFTPETNDETDTGDVDDVRISDEEIELTTAGQSLTTDDFGEGLNGDPTKVKPAALWGLSGVFIWLTAWFMGRRLAHKWAVYALGLVPFGIVLWSTFVNVDQALPSY